MVSQASRRGERGDRGGGDRGGERDRRGGRGGRGRGDREQRQREDDSGGFNERVVHTRRIAKVVKGGRRLRFNALVVVGDGQGRVGAGMGKALAIPDAVRKGTAVARRSTVTIPMKGSTIPHEISVRKGASIVIIKPAPLGTGVIAAGAMRAMLELGGVQDVVGKSLGSRNPINIVQATMEALSLLRDPETERANRLGLNAPEPEPEPAPEAAAPPTPAAETATAPVVETPPAETVAAPPAEVPAADPVTETPAETVASPPADAPPAAEVAVAEPVAETSAETTTAAPAVSEPEPVAEPSEAPAVEVEASDIAAEAPAVETAASAAAAEVETEAVVEADAAPADGEAPNAAASDADTADAPESQAETAAEPSAQTDAATA